MNQKFCRSLCGDYLFFYFVLFPGAGNGSRQGRSGAPAIFFIGICLLGLVLSDNSTIGDSIIEDVSEVTNTGNNLDADTGEQTVAWGEWSPWSKWSGCSRSCGGGISRQQRRCRRKPCKGRSWSTKYKICNPEPCEKPSDFRAEQCAAYDDVPYSGQLLKWYPHYDPTRPCALICRGEQSLENTGSRLKQETSAEKMLPREATEALQLDSDETIVVQLADKVEDGTKCYTDGTDVCIAGQCMKVGCDLRVGSNKNTDACGVCGGNGSSCQSRYSWSLESISACSKSCGGGFKLAMAVCKSMPDETVVDDSYCDPDSRPETTRMPCNTHLCTAKWVAGEWSICSTSCGGGSRTRAIFCTEENGNETTKLPDHKCSGVHKPRNQETCNTISCPMWETNKWSECSVTCGTGIKTRTVECRDAVGSISTDCDPTERPHTEQECKTNIICPIYADEMTQPLMQPYPPPPVSEKLIDQPIPSESTFIAEEWSPCSVTCGEGIQHRDVKCKIFLEFSRTIANLPDRQCSGPKPVQTEKCVMEPCGMLENSLSYGIDAVGDSGYAEPSLTDDSYRSSAGSSGGGGYDSGIKVAPGGDVQTTYSWKEAGYTPCSATCLGGVQDLIINCVRDDTGKTVMPLLCSAETKPEERIRVCNDHPCPPRWNLSEFSPCMSPCGLGIQTRDVICIHEVTRGSTGKTVPVPNKMCPQPPPADRQYCNVWDCPVEWTIGNWGKCSKSCGGGVMKRKVTCHQIMAQGRQQSREDRECPSQKPATERPCNTRTCHDMDAGSLPIISSQNTTYNQTDLNAKVDLKIGGIAKIFQGTPFIKIRCPVRKFDKSQIIWTKDNKELRKSRKYKISKKGALKINDITASDSGIYACIAGNSHAETQLVVKFRSKEQISSEEYLRLSNSVYLQRNANLDSAPANSGESLYTDRAAAYGNRFVPIDSEDLSHERAFPSNPTKKPQRKQKTNPTPPDSTDLHREQTVTSQNQEYWPFQSESSAGRSHRTAPVAFIDNTRKETGPTKRTMADRTSGLRYQNVEENLDTLYRNTAIPDETFGPDEERIFIDVDPYDLDDSMFGLQHSDPVKITPVASKQTPVTSSNSDYVEESLKNVKRQWQDKDHRNATPKEQVQGLVPSTTSDGIGLEVFYIPDSSTGNAESQRKETERHRDSTEMEHVFSTMSLRELEESQRNPESREKGVLNRTEDYAQELEEEMKKRKTYVENDTVDESLTWTSTRDPEEDLGELALPGDKGSTEKEQEKGAPVEARDSSGEEATGLEDSEEKKNKSLSIAAAAGRNTTTDTPLASLSILVQARASRTRETDVAISPLCLLVEAVPTAFTPTLPSALQHDPNGAASAIDTSEDLVFEWVTTEWSKCSQTCGGSGFQIRGAQCTMRSTKPPGNSTRTQSRMVIGPKFCEDAGHPVVQKVRSCGFGRCPQWHTTNWTPCETSRCFNWKTAMQRRDVTCRLAGNDENDQQNVTLLDLSKCDETTRPLQRQECYNDACKGVWRVGEWSECMAPCEKEGMKYRILQCVWFGTKKPAGNACRDIPRPTVMKSCKSPQCPDTPDDCKDHSRLCSRVKSMNMCSVPLYQSQCCQTCQLEKSSESNRPEKSR